MKNGRERIVTLRWIWAAAFVFSVESIVLLWTTDILDYCFPPDTDLVAATLGCLIFSSGAAVASFTGFLSSCLIRYGHYRLGGNEIFVYAGACVRIVKVNGEIAAKGNFRVKTVALENGEEITVHILRTNRIAVQTPNGYLSKEKER